MADLDYEAERQENILRNKELLRELGLNNTTKITSTTTSKPPPSKRRKIERVEAKPTRTSARIASAPQAKYRSESPEYRPSSKVDGTARKTIKKERQTASEETSIPSPPPEDLASLRAGWSSWEAIAPPPTRDGDGVFHFDSHPIFTPNKSPAEMIREGAFGGTYFRPLWSRKLQTTIEDDYLDTLLPEWYQGLNVEKFLTSQEYDPEVNKFQVASGQTIEEWEKAGWIRHEYDVRGWFQWYCRFFRGRRCDDDDRQVGRWDRCVGEKGRWRRILLKKYLQAGVRSVTDEGMDEDAEDEAGGTGLSPVGHQTCHHWAYNVTQAALDQAWRGL